MNPDPHEASDKEPDLPPSLKRLRLLVTTLTLVMIAGFVVLITALVLRLNADPLPLPDRLVLPEGAEAMAFTQGTDWIAVVTTADEILVYDRATGALRQRIAIE